MIDTVAALADRFAGQTAPGFAAGWDQLVRLWELIVLVVRFLWGLLRFLGGGWKPGVMRGVPISGNVVRL